MRIAKHQVDSIVPVVRIHQQLSDRRQCDVRIDLVDDNFTSGASERLDFFYRYLIFKNVPVSASQRIITWSALPVELRRPASICLRCSQEKFPVFVRNAFIYEVELDCAGIARMAW